jgi:hypothetical protein
MVEARHFQRLNVADVSNSKVFGTGELPWRKLLVEGNIKEQGVGHMGGTQQAKKGNKGDQHGVEGHVEDGKISLRGHHILGDKDEGTEMIEGCTK